MLKGTFMGLTRKCFQSERLISSTLATSSKYSMHIHTVTAAPPAQLTEEVSCLTELFALGELQNWSIYELCVVLNKRNTYSKSWFTWSVRSGSLFS